MCVVLFVVPTATSFYFLFNRVLIIVSRGGDIYHVKLPKNAMGFQIGESAQIHSGGVLQATPHSVRAADVDGCSRATLAVFMEPEHGERMTVPEGMLA